MKFYEQPAVELIKFSIMDVLDPESSTVFEAGGATITTPPGQDYDEQGGGIL